MSATPQQIEESALRRRKWKLWHKSKDAPMQGNPYWESTTGGMLLSDASRLADAYLDLKDQEAAKAAPVLAPFDGWKLFEVISTPEQFLDKIRRSLKALAGDDFGETIRLWKWAREEEGRQYEVRCPVDREYVVSVWDPVVGGPHPVRGRTLKEAVDKALGGYIDANVPPVKDHIEGCPARWMSTEVAKHYVCSCPIIVQVPAVQPEPASDAGPGPAPATAEQP